MRVKYKRFLGKLFLLIFSLILSLTMLEIGLRIIEANKQDTILHFPNVLRPLNNKELYFDLVPNLNYKFKNTVIDINSDGLRDFEYSIEKPENMSRIIVLGDSVTFGVGVNANETYPKILEKKLNNNYEVINFGVIGYNTFQELNLFKSKGIKYKPDLIILGYVLNDGEERTYHSFNKLTYLYRKINFYLKRKSYFYYFITYKYAEINQILNEQKIIEKENYTYKDYLEEIYSDNKVGWNISKESLIELNNIAKENNIKFIVFLFPDLRKESLEDYKLKSTHEKIKKFSEENNILFIDLLPYYLKNKDKDLVVSKTDSHPSYIGHKIAAEAIHETLININITKD